MGEFPVGKDALLARYSHLIITKAIQLYNRRKEALQCYGVLISTDFKSGNFKNVISVESEFGIGG